MFKSIICQNIPKCHQTFWLLLRSFVNMSFQKLLTLVAHKFEIKNSSFVQFGRKIDAHVDDTQFQASVPCPPPNGTLHLVRIRTGTLQYTRISIPLLVHMTFYFKISRCFSWLRMLIKTVKSQLMWHWQLVVIDQLKLAFLFGISLYLMHFRAN